MTKVYFASPMEGFDFTTIKNNYKLVEQKLEQNGHELVNPISFYEEEISTIQSLSKNEKSKYIVSRDLERLKTADLVLIDFSVIEHKYVGCICEMVYASSLGKQVVAIAGNSKYKEHPWIVYHCDAIYNRLDDAIIALNMSAYRDTDVRESA